MSWILGPSARAAYLCVTRHLGLLLGCLIAHRHAAMAAKRPFARGAFSLLAAPRDHAYPKKSRVSDAALAPRHHTSALQRLTH